MNSKKYTDQEKEILLENPNILEVGDRSITYSNEFKIKALKEHKNGKMPMQIFIDEGIKIDIIGKKIPNWCLKRWKKIYINHGEMHFLEDQRGKKSNKDKVDTKKHSLEEKVIKLETKISYLEAQIDFLKKLKALERGMI